MTSLAFNILIQNCFWTLFLYYLLLILCILDKICKFLVFFFFLWENSDFPCFQYPYSKLFLDVIFVLFVNRFSNFLWHIFE